MAYEIPILDLSLPAGSSSLVQYSVVRLSTNNVIVAGATATGGRVLGVLQNDPTSTSHMCAVRVYGVSKCRASSSAIEAGEHLAATTGAKCANSTAATTHLFGIALEAITASTARGTNDVISVLLTHTGLSKAQA